MFVSVPLVTLNVGVAPPPPLVYCRLSSPALVNPFAIVRLVGLPSPAIVTVPVLLNAPLIDVEVFAGIVSVPWLSKVPLSVTFTNVVAAPDWFTTFTLALIVPVLKLKLFPPGLVSTRVPVLEVSVDAPLWLSTNPPVGNV